MNSSILQGKIETTRKKVYYLIGNDIGIIPILIGMREEMREERIVESATMGAIQLAIDIELAKFQERNGFGWDSPRHATIEIEDEAAPTSEKKVKG